MPKRAAPVPNRHIHTTLPPEVATKLELYLWSESEGRVPRAALQNFLVARLQEFFTNRELDLAPFLGTQPGAHVISGRPDTILLLQSRMSLSEL